MNREEIARRIPHQGTMCLLTEVLHWDAHRLVCRADSHHALDNPLRHLGRLGAACVIEYAAQAMALHGALSAAHASSAPPPRVGFLTSLRNVQLSVASLDDIVDDLTIDVEKLMGDDNNVLYHFTVTAGAQPIARGRAAVRLDAERDSGGE